MDGDEHVITEKSYWQLRVERLKAAGLCMHCGKRPHNGTTKRCDECVIRMAEYGKRYYRKCKVNANLLKDRIGDGATFREIGLALGISRTRAETIYKNALAKLWRECKRRDIDPTMIIARGFSSIALCERYADE